MAAPGSLSSLTVDRVDRNHPQATIPLQKSGFFQVKW